MFLVNLTGVGWLGAMIIAFGPRRLSPPPPILWRVGTANLRHFDRIAGLDILTVTFTS